MWLATAEGPILNTEYLSLVSTPSPPPTATSTGALAPAFTTPKRTSAPRRSVVLVVAPRSSRESPPWKPKSTFG